MSTTNYLTCSKGWKSWFLTLDHKRIGVMYLTAVLSSFALGGLFALAVRLELFQPGQQFMDPTTYNRMFTLHGAVMVFLFIIPSIPAAFGNFVLPIMLGAQDVAFPRLNLASFYLWMAGAVFFLVSLLGGGIETGWTFYTPYSTTTADSSVVSALMGVFVLGFSSIFTGMNFIVTIHQMRPKGMTWFKMPLFLWAIYGTALIQVLATPVLGITGLLLIVERVAHIGVFDPALGGDPVLFQHFFWFYSHPAVYIMILPAMGIVSELIAAGSRKEIFGYRFIAFSSIAIAILGFLVWGHHMFTSGQSVAASVVFSALTFTVAIPSAIKVFNWLSTMYKGAIVLNTPMCYGLSFISLFGIGGLTGLFLGTLSVDIHLHDTYFIVAHFHYVMMGSTAVAFMGGLHYWWPKMFGKMYNEALARVCCLFVFIGFNLTFLPQFVLGTRGMPRRYFDYPERFQFLHQLSTIGAVMLFITFFVMFSYLLHSLVRGKPAPMNPWGANTNEWKCSSPPPFNNFDVPPPMENPYDHTNLVFDEKLGGYRAKQVINS